MVLPLSEDFLKVLHKIVLENDPKATRGYMQESMIGGSMQRALTEVYEHEPFGSVIDKAAALMYSIIVFHPFNDGNKRTALLAVFFFLLFNGYQFRITEDAVNLTLKVAKREIRKEKTISHWLRGYCRKNLLLIIYSRLFFSRIHTSLHKEELFLSTLVLPLLDVTRRIWPKA